MKKAFLMLSVIMTFSTVLAQELVLTGNQESVIQYKLEQSIVPFDGIDVLMVSFVVPGNFKSSTYSQTVSDLKFDFNPLPREQEEAKDDRGNVVKKFYWDAPEKNIQAVISLKADNKVQLTQLNSRVPFPLADIPAEVKVYLQATNQVQSGNAEIQKKAHQLTAEATTELQAVQAILHYVVDQMRYVLVPEQYDALYAFNTGKGNCQNYSHLAAALARAVGIPTRIVNGITLKKAYDIEVGNSEYSFEMAQGRHSWIEAYFPDLGWLPFDPQQTEFFVSNRYLRIEVGLDNEETVQDGLVRWSQSRGSEELTPKLEEAIESQFVTDNVSLLSQKTLKGPRKLLLTPALQPVIPVLAATELPEKPQPEPASKPEPAPEAEPEPEHHPAASPRPEVDFTKLTYNAPFEYGNLEFPRRFDFLYARLSGQDNAARNNELKRNFMVETAEYVTGREQYAQKFVLQEPVLLTKLGLALHNFGGNGLLWVELSEDENGKPGAAAAASKKLGTRNISNQTGYDWVDFDLSSNGLILSPGEYWFTLNYSGSPIVNWFYSYGKPVGPVDGTRSRMMGARDWDKVLSYEFNYRVVGKGAKK